MDVIEAIYHRRSVRDYKSDAVPRETIDALVVAAAQAPSETNLQPWAFIIVEGREVLSRYAERASSGTSSRRWVRTARFPDTVTNWRTRPSTSFTGRPL